MPARPLRIGLIGAGYVAPFHLRGWAGLGSGAGGARVVAIADPDRERAEACAREFGIDEVFEGPEAMLEGAKLDALDIASPRALHAAHVDLAIAQSLPTLCQKPLAPTLAEAEAMAARAADRIRLMVHENWRFRPLYRHVGAALGELPGLRFCRTVMRTTALLPDAAGVRPAVQRQPFMAGERRLALAEVLIHHLDATRYLCGDLVLRQAWLQRSDPDLLGETAAHLVLETKAGMPVIVSGDMMAAGTPSGAADWLELIGDGWRIETSDGAFHRYAGNDLVEECYFDRLDDLQAGFDGTIRHFVEALVGDRPFETDVADNLKTLRLVEAAYGSGW